MKLTKKPAVKLSDNTPITYLLSYLCNCTVCKCQEFALNKAPVLLTTLNNLLLYIVGDRRDFCLQNRWNSKTLQHAPPPNKPAKNFILNFKPLETKRKEQSDSKQRQWLTTSLTGPSRTKLLEALRVNWDLSFHTSVPQWLIVSQGRLWDLALMRKGAFSCNLTGKGWVYWCFNGIVFFQHKWYMTCIK